MSDTGTPTSVEDAYDADAPLATDGHFKDDNFTGDDFEALFEGAPCGFLCVSPDWRIERANATFADWTGHAAPALTGRALIDLLDIAGKIYVNTHFAPLLRLQGRFDEVALNVVRADGTKLPVLVNARERRDADGTLRMVLVSVFNATDRRRYETELLDARNGLREANETLERRVEEAVAERLKAEEALAHAQRMEAIGNLSAGIAHDFNNLLQVIGGNLQLLRKHVTGERGVARIANAIGGVERGARMAGQLLAFGRRQTLAAEVHDLGSAVEVLVDTLVGTIGSEVELRVRIEDAPDGAEGVGGGVHAGAVGDGEGRLNACVDLALLENAVINLTVNARDAMRDEDGVAMGSITLTVERRMLDGREGGTAAGTVEAGDYVTVAVTDTGGGMPPEIARRVFDPFFTTKGPGQGTGLGLSMVYGFATQSDGHVTIDSAPSEGTTVRLWLPHSHEKATTTDTVATTAVARGHETILVVEDDEGVLDIARELLGDLGYEVLTASDGTNALAVLDAHKPIHLVLTDIVMPGTVRGTDLAALVRERHPDTKVVFTTGYADAAARVDMVGGEHTILRKPFTSEVLGRVVRTAIDGAAYDAGAYNTGANEPTVAGGDVEQTSWVPGTDEPSTVRTTQTDAVPSTAAGAMQVVHSGNALQGSTTGPRVLFVEDEFLIRLDAAEMLSDLGCTVTDVGTIAEALTALEDEPYDVLVTDIGLKDGSGVDLARQVRERQPTIRIVFATGHGAVDGADALNAAVLTKPYDGRSACKALGIYS